MELYRWPPSNTGDHSLPACFCFNKPIKAPFEAFWKFIYPVSARLPLTICLLTSFREPQVCKGCHHVRVLLPSQLCIYVLTDLSCFTVSTHLPNTHFTLKSLESTRFTLENILWRANDIYHIPYLTYHDSSRVRLYIQQFLYHTSIRWFLSLLFTYAFCNT